MAWYFYLIQFFAGLLFANSAPHFFRGVSGERFQTPFATPHGVGESSPLVNVLWGLANFAVGFALLRRFQPSGPEEFAGWLAVGAGMLVLSVFCALHFGRVRGNSA